MNPYNWNVNDLKLMTELLQFCKIYWLLFFRTVSRSGITATNSYGCAVRRRPVFLQNSTISLCSLLLSASLFFQVHQYLYPKWLFICIYLLEKAFAFWVQFYLLSALDLMSSWSLCFYPAIELALSLEKLANESCFTCTL